MFKCKKKPNLMEAKKETAAKGVSTRSKPTIKPNVKPLKFVTAISNICSKLYDMK